MTNAKNELLEHIGSRTVKYIHLYHTPDWDTEVHVHGTLEQVLPHLDFEYDDGYGRQNLFGTIWYEDGTWSVRGEYDGREWWVDRVCPEIRRPDRPVTWTQGRFDD